ESAVVKIDVSALASNSASGLPCTGVKLGKIVYSTFGMSAKLLWVADVNTICWDLNENYTDSEDFTDFGGIVNTALASGKTGDIALTTT